MDSNCIILAGQQLSSVPLEKLLDSSPVPTFVLNADHVVTHWNKGCEQVTGIPAPSIVGTRDAWRAFYSTPRPVMADIILEHGNEADVMRFYEGKYRASRSVPNAFEAEDFFSQFPDGGRWLFFTAAPLIDAEGQVVGAIETLQDITERKRAELALHDLNETLERRIGERTAELASANHELHQTITHLEQMQVELLASQHAALCASRAKSDFLATMSHEIRTPMNGIIGMTDLLLDTELNDEQRDYLKIVKVSADGLITIINDILDFSKMEAGKLTLEEIPFNLHGMVSSVMKQMALRADEKHLELICDVQDDVPVQVLGDPGRIRQVLINLLGNAIKFTKQGEVELRVSRTGSAGAREQICFAVRDSGIGIAPEKQQAIFEAFSQADTSTTREYGGTGLGLSISNRLAHLMGGSIRVESQLGLGSTFSLDVALQETACPAPARLEAGTLRGKRALVIDDNAINRRIFREMLQRWGLIVEEEVSALALLANLEQRRQESFDILLVDYHMPGMDGFELIEHLVQNRAFGEARILMLSSAAMPGQAARCLALGIAGYLTKPVDRSELLESIHRILAPDGGSAAASPAAAEKPAAPGSLEGSLSILVAEDNLVNQKLIRTLLANRGHRVTLADNGQEAVEQCRHTAFDLILMDVQMPVLGGIEATEQIRAMGASTSAGQRVPIYALSAAVLPEVREKIRLAGVDGYLTKPINRPELYQVLAALQAARARTLPATAFDYLAALRQCDAEIVEIIGGAYLAAYEADIAKLLAAGEQRDTGALERLAHTQKGLASQFNAKRLTALLFEIESQARKGEFDQRQIEAAVQEIRSFALALAQHLAAG